MWGYILPCIVCGVQNVTTAWIIWKRDNSAYSCIYRNECQGELKCTVCVCVCLLSESQKSEPYVHLCCFAMLRYQWIWITFLMYPFLWDQGDIGPVGEMGLPGPNGLKVLSHTHMETVISPVLFFIVLFRRSICQLIPLRSSSTQNCSHVGECRWGLVLWGHSLTYLLVLVPGGARKSRRTRTERW